MKGKAGCLERKWSRFHSKAEWKSGKASASSGPSFSGRLRRTLANIFAPALGVCGPFCLVGLLQIKLQRAAPKIPTLIITVCYLLKIRGRVQRYSVFTQRPNNKNECKCLLGSGHLATLPLGRRDENVHLEKQIPGKSSWGTGSASFRHNKTKVKK